MKIHSHLPSIICALTFQLTAEKSRCVEGSDLRTVVKKEYDAETSEGEVLRLPRVWTIIYLTVVFIYVLKY